MCGIAGILGENSDNEFRLQRMASALARRGPDGSGIWYDPEESIGFAHTRLSIIDLSSAGNQPMTFGQNRYWITFNGEIYNYKEIRKILESCGIVFSSQTDTEVILKGWAQWGPDLLNRLRGMFAFALWDSSERLLTLCRDRMGIKPLLWAKTESGFVFGSTLKAILDSGLVKPNIDPQGIFDLLATGSVCQPGTIIRGVHSIEPGTYMRIGPEMSLEVTRYWNLATAVTALQPEYSELSYSEAVSFVRELLDEACHYHLVSDVPVGSFLSGGVDSTAITALMSRHMNSPVKSFSIGFDERCGMMHELDDARHAANHIGCDHTEIVVTGKDVESEFDDFIYSLDQPSSDGINTYIVSRNASKSVKVALSGLGGDEVFAGYRHFALLQDAASKKFDFTEKLLAFFHKLRPNRFTWPYARACALRRSGLPNRYASLRRILSDERIAFALTNEMKKKYSPGFIESYIRPKLGFAGNSLCETSLIECQHYLLNTLLRDADALSMANGVEVRPMMLDHHLVERVLALPAHFKIVDGRPKALLKDAVNELLPTRILNRSKTGFTLPLGWWMRNELRNRLVTTLDGETARSIFTETFLRNCKEGIDKPSNHRVLWTIMILIYWIDFL